MPKLDYTNDLREKAGEANSASELTDNFGDLQTLGQGLDWENVTPGSIEEGHVYNPGTEPLKDAEASHTASTNITSDNTWTQTDSITVSNTVNAGTWIFVYFGGRTQTGAATTDTHEMQLKLDGSVVAGPLEIGASSIHHSGGTGVYAFEATSTSHTLTSEFRIDAGATLAVENTHLVAFAVHR